MWHNERKFIWVTEKKVMIENGRVMSVHVQHKLWTYIRSVKVLRHPICVYFYMLIFTNILYLQQELLIAWFQIFANFDIYQQYCNEFWGTLYDVNTIISSATPVLNIGRVGRDIVRYLLFFLLSIRYGEIVRHIVCSKKRPIFEKSADKSPDMK